MHMAVETIHMDLRSSDQEVLQVREPVYYCLLLSRTLFITISAG